MILAIRNEKNRISFQKFYEEFQGTKCRITLGLDRPVNLREASSFLPESVISYKRKENEDKIILTNQHAERFEIVQLDYNVPDRNDYYFYIFSADP